MIFNYKEEVIINKRTENIEDKELEKIEINIVKTEEEPIELLSGEWIMGSDADVPEGRYGAYGSANFNHQNEVIAAISVAGPTMRINTTNLDFITKEVVEAAHCITITIKGDMV